MIKVTVTLNVDKPLFEALCEFLFFDNMKSYESKNK